jgi:hypothetical protein
VRPRATVSSPIRGLMRFHAADPRLSALRCGAKMCIAEKRQLLTANEFGRFASRRTQARSKRS